MVRIRTFFKLLKDAFLLLRRTEPLVLSSSTAFFATFSLSPILLLLVNFFSLYFASDRLSRRIFGKLGSTIGFETSRELEKIVANFMNIERSWWLTIIGIVFFVFVSTTLLNVVKTNIHKVWRIRHAASRIRYRLRDRALQVFLILLSGALFVISFIIDSSLAISLDYLQTIIPDLGIIFIQFLNFAFSLILVTVWFGMLFKLLPEAKISWDVVFSGALLTALLFIGGRFVLGEVLVHARVATIFGASASFALLLLFIFYCSFILYFGAAFTYVYAAEYQMKICAGKNAVEYEERAILTDNGDSRMQADRGTDFLPHSQDQLSNVMKNRRRNIPDPISPQNPVHQTDRTDQRTQEHLQDKIHVEDIFKDETDLIEDEAKKKRNDRDQQIENDPGV